jgi:hypothetical protein
MIDKPIADEMRRVRHNRAEHAYARKHVNAYADKQYANVSENEARDHYLGRGVRERLKKPTIVLDGLPIGQRS